MVRRDRAHHSLVRHVRVRCAWLAGKTPAAKQPAAATEARIHREVLLDAFSQLTGKQAVYERISADLFGAGLVRVQSLTTDREGHRVMKKRTTALHDQFLAFVRSPD